VKTSKKTGASGPAKGPSQEALAADLSTKLGFPVSRKMVRTWKTKGYPLDDVAALTAKLRNQERSPLPKPADPNVSGDSGDALTPDEIDDKIRTLQQLLLDAKDYEVARTIKTQLSGMREIIKVQQERGVLMPTADAEAAGRLAGQASRQAWEKIEDELPPMLEGLTAAQMKSKLRDYARARCLELSGHVHARPEAP
jgi:DNA-binding transcriptional MerR regulator